MADRLKKSAAALMIALALPLAGPAQAQYKQKITNDLGKCRGDGPAVRVTATEIKSSAGKVRVQLYRATQRDWLADGRWINRIEVPAQAGTMTFCLPVPEPGSYAVAIRHDINGNGHTDLTQDGGGMSNNPSINVFNLGKPSYTKTAFSVGHEVKSISVRVRYL